MHWAVEKPYEQRRAREKEGSRLQFWDGSQWEDCYEEWEAEGSASTNVLPSAIEREAPTWKGTIWLDLGRGRPLGIGV